MQQRIGESAADQRRQCDPQQDAPLQRSTTGAYRKRHDGHHVQDHDYPVGVDRALQVEPLDQDHVQHDLGHAQHRHDCQEAPLSIGADQQARAALGHGEQATTDQAGRENRRGRCVGGTVQHADDGGGKDHPESHQGRRQQGQVAGSGTEALRRDFGALAARIGHHRQQDRTEDPWHQQGCSRGQLVGHLELAGRPFAGVQLEEQHLDLA